MDESAPGSKREAFTLQASEEVVEFEARRTWGARHAAVLVSVLLAAAGAPRFHALLQSHHAPTAPLPPYVVSVERTPPATVAVPIVVLPETVEPVPETAPVDAAPLAPVSQDSGEELLALEQQADGSEESFESAQEAAPSESPQIIAAPVGVVWCVQVQAHRESAPAEELARRMAMSGYGVMIEEADVHGKHFFRVLIGPYGSRSEAAAARTKLARDHHDAFVRRLPTP